MTIPPPVQKALTLLTQHNFEAYLVGGCVRDLILGAEPKDWDITTNAAPEKIEEIFTKAGYKAFYENTFGTVTVITDELPIEITPYRLEGKYSDKRHPDEIRWAKTLEEDLARRDFTINAIALKIQNPLTSAFERSESAAKAESSVLRRQKSKIQNYTKYEILNTKYFEIIDLFGGHEDLKKKIIRTVGNPDERFNEDALRLMRAVRFAVELKFTIELNTYEAIKKNAKSLEVIAKERVRDELIKIIQSLEPEKGIRLLHETSLLHYVLPELEEGIGIIQRGPHRFDVFTHNVLSLKWAARETEDIAVRLASLFHDIGKPRVREVTEGGKITFYDHPAAGAKMAEKALERLRFPRKIVYAVSHLVYHHMFYYDVGRVSASGVRRLLVRVGGKEAFKNLLALRRADRRATPVPKTHPYRLRHLEYMAEKVGHDPLSRFQLVINGDEVKAALGIPEGIRVGLLISALLAQVLEYPKKNTKEYLLKELKALNKKSDEELKELGKFVEQKRQERDRTLKEKYYVK